MVSVWSAHVAADPAGVPWNRRETGDAGKATGMPKASMSPPVQAMNSAPRVGPAPGMLTMISASRCSRKQAAMGASVPAISSSRASTEFARLCTTAAAVVSPVTAACWACVVATAVLAMVWAPRILRFFSQVVSRLGPTRRRAAGVW